MIGEDEYKENPGPMKLKSGQDNFFTHVCCCVQRVVEGANCDTNYFWSYVMRLLYKCYYIVYVVSLSVKANVYTELLLSFFGYLILYITLASTVGKSKTKYGNNDTKAATTLSRTNSTKGK